MFYICSILHKKRERFTRYNLSTRVLLILPCKAALNIMCNKCDTQLPPSLGCVVQLILPIQPAYISLGVRVHTGIHVPLITVQL
jgi:hypothetical protein